MYERDRRTSNLTRRLREGQREWRSQREPERERERGRQQRRAREGERSRERDREIETRDYDRDREVIYRRRNNSLFGERLRIDISNMIYDTCESIVIYNKSVNDYKNFEFN